VKLLAAIAIAAGALTLTAASSTAGAARGAPHQLLGLVQHIAHASHFAPARRMKQAAGFNCVSACSLYESTINQYFTDVAADSVNGVTTNVYSVPTQYSSIQYNETFAGSYVDGSPLPTTKTCQDGFDKYCVTDAQLQTEIGKVIAKNGWPTLSWTTLYFIFTPANVGVCAGAGSPSAGNPCSTNVFCAYHSASNTFVYAVEPDDAAVAGNACDTNHQAPAGNGADDTISTISHEQIEAITDPLGDGWIANDGPAGSAQDEIGDLCAYDFGTPLGTTLGGADYNQVINGHDYYLQLEYSNAANSNTGGCVPYLGGPVTAPDPHFPDGTGPLVLQSLSGSVMTTSTVYAIYWVPAAPANSQLPTISGTPKIGKKLKASHGTWSNAPMYTYRWLRCSSAGASCKGIAMAAGSAYTLVKADKGHRLEVRVTATNAAGSMSASSAPTGTVTKSRRAA
jgi:hypothetical protein